MDLSFWILAEFLSSVFKNDTPISHKSHCGKTSQHWPSTVYWLLRGVGTDSCYSRWPSTLSLTSCGVSIRQVTQDTSVVISKAFKIPIFKCGKPLFPPDYSKFKQRQDNFLSYLKDDNRDGEDGAQCLKIWVQILRVHIKIWCRGTFL